MFDINQNLSCVALWVADGGRGDFLSVIGGIALLMTNLLYADPQAFDHNDVLLLKCGWGPDRLRMYRFPI